MSGARNASTSVELADGQSFAIAGLLQDQVNSSVEKYPLLGDIPVLVWLFKTTASQTTGRELVVFITPSVLKVDVAQAPPATQKK